MKDRKERKKEGGKGEGRWRGKNKGRKQRRWRGSRERREVDFSSEEMNM